MSTWNSRLGLETLGSRQIENAQKSPRTLVSIQKSQIPCYACDWWRTRWNRDELSNLLLCSLVLETPYPQIPRVCFRSYAHFWTIEDSGCCDLRGHFSGIVIRDPRIWKSNRFHVDIFRFFLTGLRIILQVLRKWWVVFLKSWTSARLWCLKLSWFSL